MAVRTQIHQNFGVYFITFTCYKWLSLIDRTQSYDLVFQQFDYLKSQGHFINAYVIMPNHIHLILGIRNSKLSINSIIGNVKRFLTYNILKRLKATNDYRILSILKNGVNRTKKAKGHHFVVFRPSFDAKQCYSHWFLEQKLNYIHQNPCVKNWKLADSAEQYIYSSAGFYATGKEGIYPVTNVFEMEDIDLFRSSSSISR